jgi:pimeloyl-ACP methyl ester carboxylesterase
MTAAASIVHRVEIGDASVAYLDTGGGGSPLLLLHGCPFSKFVWRSVIPRLSDRFRCVAPDLLGLGETETPDRADWSLPAQVDAIVGLLDRLGIERVALVGHDQGGAVAQLIAIQYPGRVSALVLADAEAYDNWPSAEEVPFVRVTQRPLIGPLVLWAWSRRPLFRWALAHGQAVHQPSALTDELVDGYIAANLATSQKRAKTRRFLATQLDPTNQANTHNLAGPLHGVEAPTLILWGEQDVHFPPSWARRLAADIPATQRVEILPGCGHLLMEEHPDKVAALIGEFLTTTTRSSAEGAGVQNDNSPGRS